MSSSRVWQETNLDIFSFFLSFIFILPWTAATVSWLDCTDDRLVCCSLFCCVCLFCLLELQKDNSTVLTWCLELHRTLAWTRRPSSWGLPSIPSSAESLASPPPPSPWLQHTHRHRHTHTHTHRHTDTPSRGKSINRTYWVAETHSIFCSTHSLVTQGNPTHICLLLPNTA